MHSGMRIALCANRTMNAGEPSDPLADLACELITRGHEVVALVPEVVELPAEIPSKRIAGSNFPRACAEAVAADGRFEIVHAFEGAWQVGAGPAPHVHQCLGGTLLRRVDLQCRLSTWPTLRRLTDVLRLGQARRLGAERAIATLPSPTHLVVPSHYVAAQLRQYYGVGDDRLHVVPEGPDPRRLPEARRGEIRLEHRKRWSMGDRDTLIAAHLRDARIDGLREVLAAAVELKAELTRAPGKRSFKLALTGAGSIGAERAVAAAGLTEQVLVLGSCDPIPILAAADVVFSASWDDGAGRWITAALAWQTPAVVSRFDGASELLEDGQNGYVLDTPADTVLAGQRLATLTESIRRYKFRGNLADVAQSARAARYADDMLLVYMRVVRPDWAPMGAQRPAEEGFEV